MRETLRTTKTIAPKTFALFGLFALASLSSFAQSPGGVSTTHLKLWLKADAGTSTTTDGNPVTGWIDNSPTPNTITDGPITTVKPVYIANGTNYNPGIFYAAGTYHVFSIPTIPVLNSTVFLAGTPVAASSGGTFHAPFASDFLNDYPLALDNGNFGYHNNVGSGTTFYPLAWAYDEPSFARARMYLNSDPVGNPVGNFELVKGGGDPVTNFPDFFTDLDTSTGKYMYIGGDPSGSAFGKVSEVIIFDDPDALNSTELRKIDSYLMMKYGVLNQEVDATNFILSDETQVWGTDFSHDILTIVRDDASALAQKQAHSTSDDVRLYTGTLEATNSENTAPITDKSAVVIASDGASVEMTTELTVTAPILSRFQRTWEIQATNFTDNFSIEIKWDSASKFDMSAFQLLISSDASLSPATQVPATFTNAGGYLIISGISGTSFTSGTPVYFSIGSTTLTTLPAAMTFSAAVTPDSKVALNWQTTSEINNNYFTVERSVDAQSWEAITKVNGAGTTTSVKNYSFVDKNPYTGVSYYRLKQTDLDGKYSYSKVKTVKVDKNRNSILTIYPNPVSGILYIKAGATELATLRIFNMTGIDVTTLVKTIETTTSGRVLDLSRLPNGNYNIKTTTAVTKVIKN